MTNYEELLMSLQQTNAEKADFLEEEIDIMVHKLKFLPSDSFPNVVILSQKNDFQPMKSSLLDEKVKLAGGNLVTDIYKNISKLIVVQDNASLYGELPSRLMQDDLQATLAYQTDAIYIIEKADFDSSLYNFLEETEILAEIIQSKYFFFGHEGNYWTKFGLN